MTESPEQELEEPRAVEDDRLDLSSQEESLASVDVLREWIAQLKHEISNRDSVIVELKSAIEDASPRSELEEQRVDPCGGCQDTAPTACDGSVRPTSDVEGFHNIEALESAIAERDESISHLREQVARDEARLAAQRSEYDSLHDWVEQIEQRIELAGCYDEVFNVVPYPGGNGVEGAQAALLSVRTREDWEVERDEILRELDSLNEEVRELRLLRDAPRPPVEVVDPALLESLEIARADYDNLREAYDRLVDQYQLLDLKHLKTIDELRVRLKESESRERELADSAERYEPPNAKSNPIEADERIRAFRQHLDRIHEEESSARETQVSKLSLGWFKPKRKRK